MDYFWIVKWLHIVSSTILFGFGAGTAWYLWNAHLTRDPGIIASVGRMVIKADWIFTGTSGVVQPISGIALVYLGGYSLFEPWLLLTYLLYVLAFACWAPVVWLQIKAQKLAAVAHKTGEPLGAEYFKAMHFWFLLGWPAFIGLMVIFWLMTTKPKVW
ncbi:MAG: DUF2269 family protein [Beijerinckiaceae bacterium]